MNLKKNEGWEKYGKYGVRKINYEDKLREKTKNKSANGWEGFSATVDNFFTNLKRYLTWFSMIFSDFLYAVLNITYVL